MMLNFTIYFICGLKRITELVCGWNRILLDNANTFDIHVLYITKNY